VAAAAQIVGEHEFVIVGSQAILGSYPDAPSSLLRSQEADVYPRHAPERAIEAGWEGRLVPVQVPPRVRGKTSATAFCLEPHDLEPEILVARASDLPLDPGLRSAIASSVTAIATRLRGSEDI
jgi:hypothetical protein